MKTAEQVNAKISELDFDYSNKVEDCKRKIAAIIAKHGDHSSWVIILGAKHRFDLDVIKAKIDSLKWAVE